MNEPMTLVERLLNPEWVDDWRADVDAQLHVKRTLATMREAAAAIEAFGSRPPRKDRTKGKYAKARALRAQGFTIREIAKRLKYKTTSSIHAAIKQVKD